MMASWTHALTFTALRSLRQANAQQLCNYGILTFGGQDYLVLQHTDGKSRTNLPTVFLTPFKICGFVGACSTAGALYCGKTTISFANTDENSLLPSSRLLRCPLPDGKIMEALRLVLRHACGTPPRRLLQLPHSVNQNPQDWTTQWHLIPLYNRVTEGS